jgi:hypothetical protein
MRFKACVDELDIGRWVAHSPRCPLTFLVLLESLSPQRLAAFLLREVFAYPYAEVAEIIGTDVESTRRLVARAHAHAQGADRAITPLGGSEKRWLSAPSPPPNRATCLRWRRCWRRMWRCTATAAARYRPLGRPVNGRERVARTVLAGMSALPRLGVRIHITEVNYQPGAMAFDSHRLVGVIGLDIADGQIQTIHSIVNPDKLRRLDRVGDLGALPRAGRRSRDDG